MYIFKNTKSTFNGWNIPDGVVEITEDQYEKLMNNELKWANGVLVPHIKSLKEIQAEKDLLNNKLYKKEMYSILQWFKDNDWKLNKIILGEWSTEDNRWLEYMSERKNKRNRYDELSKLIK